MTDKPPHPSYKKHGMRLRAARIAAGVTQSQVADEIGVTVTAWNNWELGRRKLDWIAVDRFCRRYGLDMNWITNGDMSKLTYAMAERIKQIVAELG